MMPSHERVSAHPDRPGARLPGAQAVLNQPGPFSVPKLRLVEEGTSDPQVAWALGALPNPVARSDIIGLQHLDPNIRRRRVAIASLMWGYGIAGTRWGAQWVSDVSNFLSPGLDVVLAACEANLTVSAIGEGVLPLG